MRKIYLAIIIPVMVSGLAGCRHTNETTAWQLTGVARFGVSASGATVRMAAFFPADPSDMILNGPKSGPVSDVINLGTVANVDVPFTLSINAPPITTQNKYTEIFLLIWKDSDSNGLCGEDEDFSYAHSQAGDPVFRSENLDRRVWLDGAHWYYEPVIDFIMGTMTGWNQRDAEGYVPIDNAARTGAKITTAPDTYW